MDPDYRNGLGKSADKAGEAAVLADLFRLRAIHNERGFDRQAIAAVA